MDTGNQGHGTAGNFHHGDPRNDLIHVDCASHVYPDGSTGIHGMCFHVGHNEIVAICGPNGAGKSTLLEHLNGLLVPSEGSIMINGTLIREGERKQLWKEVGVVFQLSDDQLFAPTVLDDVMFGPQNLGLTANEAKKAAIEALTAVGAEDLVGKLPGYLSGGQKRLVAIAGVLAMKPKVIVLDEPTSDLDPRNCEKIGNLIRLLKEKYRISVVIATHDLDLAARIADRVCLVMEGSVFAEGPPAEIFYNIPITESAGLVPPMVVRVYLEYCKVKGIVPTERPLGMEELVHCLNM